MKRTRSGLRNSYLFHDVDYVVYVEGGTPSTDFLTAENENGSLDVAFWKTVFEHVSDSITFKFKPLGSKTQLLPIADDVEAAKIDNVIVAMDRDFDFHTNNLRDHTRVIYTRGYSWENDVWDLDRLPRIIENLSIRSPLPLELRNEIDTSIERFRVTARRLARLDVASTMTGYPPVLKRDEVRRYLCVEKGHPPYVNRSEIKKRMVQRRRERASPIRLPERGVDLGERDCCGHFVGSFGYHLLCYSLRRQGMSTATTQWFSSIAAIREFGTDIARRTRPKIAGYYESIVRDAISM